MLALAVLVGGLGVLGGCPKPPRADPHLVEQLDAEVLALKQQNQALLDRLQVCDEDAGASDALVRDLQQVFTDFEVTVERRGRLAVLVIPSSLLFSGDSLTLRAESAPVLDLLGTALRLHPAEVIWVVGHTDAPPKPTSLAKLYPTAWEWAGAQANAVRKSLVLQHGVSVTRIMVASRGDASPRFSTASDPVASRAASRRVEIVFGATLP